MRLSGRRLTLVLTTLFVVVLADRGDRRLVVRPSSQRAAGGDRRVSERAQRAISPCGCPTEAGGHPRAAEVQSVLQQYFDAINNRDYESWIGAVADRRNPRRRPRTVEQGLRQHRRLEPHRDDHHGRSAARHG